MSIHEHFALIYILSEFPEEWGFDQIISELSSGDEGGVIKPCEPFDRYEPCEIANHIIGLKIDLQRCFSPISK